MSCPELERGRNCAASSWQLLERNIATLRPLGSNLSRQSLKMKHSVTSITQQPSPTVQQQVLVSKGKQSEGYLSKDIFASLRSCFFGDNFLAIGDRFGRISVLFPGKCPQIIQRKNFKFSVLGKTPSRFRAFSPPTAKKRKKNWRLV
jgi:hypothetical protein